MHLPGFLKRPLPVAAAFLIAVPLIAAACGSNETTTAGGSTSAATQSQPQGTAPKSDTSTTTSGSAATPAAGDTTYLKAICTAANDSVNPVVSKLAADPSLLSDQKKLMDAIAPALSDLSSRLREIHPPADLQSYHDQVLARFDVLVGKAKAGQLQGIGDIANLGQGLQPPAALRERIRAAANSLPECQQSLLFGSGFFGG